MLCLIEASGEEDQVSCAAWGRDSSTWALARGSSRHQLGYRTENVQFQMSQLLLHVYSMHFRRMS